MNRTVDEVLDEAERIEGNMPHVKNPHAPKVVDGCSFEELRQSHNAVENAKQTQKNGRERKVRTTQNTLATAVLSYPVSVEALKKASPEEKQKYLHWRRDAIQFMRDEWGEDYKCAVQHTDEKFPHLHLYAVRTDFDAKQNHPGYRAQKEALANGKSGKEAEIAGAIALKAFLNSYYEQVGQKYGMARYGPRRTRSSRCKWVKEQIANDAHAQILRDRDKYKQSIKEEVAREWAETSTIGKLSFARSTASDADIKKRSNTLFREAIEQYSGQYRNAEKAIEKAVSERNDAQKKAISAERQNSHLVSRNAELESK
ncbi:plasmid recombination protein, partial [Acetobacter sp. P1H12_c]|uniref:plasmid recombination protein n=1 Tax=Acetobacter sp. P1H12_c TaxID=2762621 RepID=UPI001C041E1F